MKRLFRTYLAAATAVVLSVSFLASGAGAADRITMKIGAATINDAQHIWMKMFKEGVEERIGDRVAVELYPASQLGPIPRMVDGVLFGTIESFTTATSFLVGTEPKFQIFDAPGLYEGPEHVNAVLRHPEFRERVLAYGADKGIRSIALMQHSPFAVASKRPIRVMQDFKGQKIRTFGSPMQIELFKALGSAPVPMPLSEVQPALQTGNIDGLIAAAPVMYAFKYYDGAPHQTLMPGWPLIFVVTVNGQWFDSLPEDVRTVLLEEARKAEEALPPLAAEGVERTAALWVESGGTIEALSAADSERLLALMREVTEPVLAANPTVAGEFAILRRVAEATASPGR